MENGLFSFLFFFRDGGESSLQSYLPGQNSTAERNEEEMFPSDWTPSRDFRSRKTHSICIASYTWGARLQPVPVPIRNCSCQSSNPPPRSVLPIPACWCIFRDVVDPKNTYRSRPWSTSVVILFYFIFFPAMLTSSSKQSDRWQDRDVSERTRSACVCSEVILF